MIYISTYRIKQFILYLYQHNQRHNICSSMCKVLENRAQQDEERMDQLTNQLKEARLLAEDADGKSDEVNIFIQRFLSTY